MSHVEYTAQIYFCPKIALPYSEAGSVSARAGEHCGENVMGAFCFHGVLFLVFKTGFIIDGLPQFASQGFMPFKKEGFTKIQLFFDRELFRKWILNKKKG